MTLKHVHQEEWKINPYQNETLPSPARGEGERGGRQLLEGRPISLGPLLKEKILVILVQHI